MFYLKLKTHILEKQKEINDSFELKKDLMTKRKIIKQLKKPDLGGRWYDDEIY
jgi:hypothetical protein